MTAMDLTRLLRDRHSDACFVAECKMGAQGSRALDAWVLLPTWAPLTAIGYEVKVSRSDWLKDQKFEEYRKVCHLFFVVAPKGVVDRAEVPPGVGLLEPIGKGDGQRLVMRVKPVRQEPDDSSLARLMAYALMWKRVEADPSAIMDRERRMSYWRTWVEQRKDASRLGLSVSSRMRELLRTSAEEQARAQRRADELQWAAEALIALGVTRVWDQWSAKREIEKALNGHRASVQTAIQHAVLALQRMQEVLVEHEP